MASLLYRLGHFATRRRWAVLIAWLALLLGLGAAAAALSGTMTSSFTIPGTPAQAALDQLGEKIPGAGDATGRIVLEQWLLRGKPDGEQGFDAQLALAFSIINLNELSALHGRRPLPTDSNA